MNNSNTLSLIIATYGREQVLADTILSLLPLLRSNDELIVIDQTVKHMPETQSQLVHLSSFGRIRWYIRREPGICKAMNCGACLAQNDILLFLDDDIIPTTRLLEVHRETLGKHDIIATCGQVFQPWNTEPLTAVRDYAERFQFAFNQECDILALIGCNFGIRRETFLSLGGLDENFTGVAYRWEAEFSYRLFQRTGRKIRFLPEASIRHLQAPSGGTRSHGTKDTWKHITGSVGDYYFALKCLPFLQAIRHTLSRLVRAPLNRSTIRRPWVIPSLFIREIVALIWACTLLSRRNRNYIKNPSQYDVSEPAPFNSLHQADEPVSPAQ